MTGRSQRGSTQRGLDRGAKRDAPGKIGLGRRSEAQALARARTQAVGADQQIGAVGYRHRAALQADRDLIAFGREAGQGRAQSQDNVGLPPDRLDQRILQVGAMNRQIGRAPAALGVIERQPHEFAAVRAAQRPDRVRNHGDGAHGPEDPEAGQDAGRVRRQLQPGAEFLERVGPLVQRDLETRPRQRQSRGESADPGAGDDGAPAHASGRVAELAFGRLAGAAQRSRRKRSGSSNRNRSPRRRSPYR